MRNDKKEAEQQSIEPLMKYRDMLYRIAFSNMKSKADAEDAVQEAFCRYLKAPPVFDGDAHEKAWLIRVVINICRDMQKSAWYTRTVAFDEVPEKEMKHFKLPFQTEDETIWFVMELPEHYRNPLYLFYYEDYSVKEIAQIMELEEGTVKTRLKRGREMIKERILFGKQGNKKDLTDKV